LCKTRSESFRLSSGCGYLQQILFAREYQLFLSLLLLAIAALLLVWYRRRSKKRKGSQLNRWIGFVSCALIAAGGYFLGASIPVLGNWISFSFIAAAFLGLLIVFTH
jgi:uncharacterized membrane protein